MNCKPGDLAMVVGGWFPQLHGRIITVYNVVRSNELGPCWSYSGNLSIKGYVIEYVEDCCLKAIRDPGDDAVDEMVQLVGEATARNT